MKQIMETKRVVTWDSWNRASMQVKLFFVYSFFDVPALAETSNLRKLHPAVSVKITKRLV